MNANLPPPKQALQRAIEVLGTQRALGDALGVKQAAVWCWLHRDKHVPAERCPDIERVTAGRVRCEDLRPDVRWDVVRGHAPSSPEDRADAA